MAGVEDAVHFRLDLCHVVKVGVLPVDAVADWCLKAAFTHGHGFSVRAAGERSVPDG
jgi:hypothetical protein